MAVKRGIIYLNIGVKHFNHLVVSLWSLRQKYDIPICILAGGPESIDAINTYILPEKKLAPIQIREFEFDNRGRGSAYFAKTSMCDLSPFQKSIFLDADTLVMGRFRELWPDDDEVRFTQFADWTTFTKRIRTRISKWEDILPAEVSLQMKHEYPAINTGVLGFSRRSKPFMARWHRETMKNISFICDELSAQLLYIHYPHMLLDERWNCSPRFSWKRQGLHVEKADPRICHGHGKKFLKNNRDVQEGWWMPVYRSALEEDIAQIRSWTNSRSKEWRQLIRPRKYYSDDQCKQLYSDLGVAY